MRVVALCGLVVVLLCGCGSNAVRLSTTVRRVGLAAVPLIREDVRPNRTGFFGEWIRPRRVSRHTAVLVLGGSDGGIAAYTESIASTLARDGYPVLALAYFGEPGLPQTLARIPLEYFQRALAWMRTQPAVDPNKLVTLGVSRGAELSLILASTYPQSVRAAVGYVPIEYVVNGYPDQSQPAWTYRGRPYRGDRYKIPVERIRGPVFIVGAADDRVWPSARAVHAITARMRAHGRNQVTGLVYQGAGHALGTAVPAGGVASGTPPGFGGSASADERARDDSWPKLLRFLARL
jgi:dienelactone hydrolase